MSRNAGVAVLFAASLAAASPAGAQPCTTRLICPAPSNSSSTVRGLLDTIFRTDRDLRPPTQLTDAEYERRLRLSIDGIGIGVGAALASFPIASSAGFAFVVDRNSGDRVLKSVSFGPTFTERSLTNGQGVLNLGVSYQRLAFDTLQGVDLKTTGFKTFSQLGDYLNGGTADPRLEGFEVGDAFFTKLDVKSNVFVVSGSYGLTSRLDVGWAVPVASMSVRGQLVREYNAALDFDAVPAIRPLYPNRAGSLVLKDEALDVSGIGDVVLRTKYGFGPANRQIGMLMGEVRLPTGNEENLLGTGKTTFRVLAGGTHSFGSGGLHVNGGYTSGGLSDEINFSAGTDVALLARKQLTLTLDFISQTLRDTVTGLATDVSTNEVLGQGGPLPRRVVISHGFWERGTSTLHRMAVGAKYSLGGNWLLTGSGQFRLNDHGYQAKFVGFVGLEHTWVTQ